MRADDQFGIGAQCLPEGVYRSVVIPRDYLRLCISDAPLLERLERAHDGIVLQIGGDHMIPGF